MKKRPASEEEFLSAMGTVCGRCLNHDVEECDACFVRKTADEFEAARDKSTVDRYQLYEFCNRHRYFTSGSNIQYEELFAMNEDGASMRELAFCIWFCSDPDNRKTSTEILQELQTETGR
jgi:hypothetical protein